MRDNPKPYELYKHFKGNTYQIICIAKDSEDASCKVVYQGMYEPYDIYVRDLAMFMEEVDRAKYPNASQRYRFEQITNNVAATKVEAAPAAEATPIELSEENLEGAVEDATSSEAPAPARTEAPKVLLEFLDADTADGKLFVLSNMEDDIDEHILTSMELSIGMEPGEASLKERYRDIRNFLTLKQKYERSHR